MQPVRRYWLVKTEPLVFSIQHLARAKNRTTGWDGVRNYQARNFLRDAMKVGDGVLIHHSNADPPALAGTGVVVREGYPDPTAWDPKDEHFDPRSTREKPVWFMVDIQLEAIFPRPVPLPELRETPGLERMMLLQKGARLSVQPVTGAEWKIIQKLVTVKD